MADPNVTDSYGQDWQDAMFQKLAPDVERLVNQSFGYARGAQFGAQGEILSKRLAALKTEIMLKAAEKTAEVREKMREEGVQKERDATQNSRAVQERMRQEQVAKEEKIRQDDVNQKRYEQYMAQQKELKDRTDTEAEKQNRQKGVMTKLQLQQMYPNDPERVSSVMKMLGVPDYEQQGIDQDQMHSWLKSEGATTADKYAEGAFPTIGSDNLNLPTDANKGGAPSYDGNPSFPAAKDEESLASRSVQSFPWDKTPDANPSQPDLPTIGSSYLNPKKSGVPYGSEPTVEGLGKPDSLFSPPAGSDVPPISGIQGASTNFKNLLPNEVESNGIRDKLVGNFGKDYVDNQNFEGRMLNIGSGRNRITDTFQGGLWHPGRIDPSTNPLAYPKGGYPTIRSSFVNPSGSVADQNQERKKLYDATDAARGGYDPNTPGNPNTSPWNRTLWSGNIKRNSIDELPKIGRSFADLGRSFSWN